VLAGGPIDLDEVALSKILNPRRGGHPGSSSSGNVLQFKTRPAAYATKGNKDGNEDVTGLPTVLGEAPLGTYVGWNLATTGWYGPNASNGPGSVGQVFAGAGNSGGYMPFWDTKVHRQAANDPRLSLQERYGTHDGYICVVTAAANAAVQERFLLESDATTLIANAKASNVLGSPYVPTPADIMLANSLCSH
jgi:hypothetical protein